MRELLESAGLPPPEEILFGENVVRMLRDVGGIAVHVEVTSSESVDLAIEQVERDLGPISVLVNNAGWDELQPFLRTDEAFWDKVIEINFKGCLRLSHRVVPGMVEREYGR